MADKNDAPVEERLERLEALIKRVLSLQQFDDLTIGSAHIPSNLCTHSGTSNGCSTKSVGCEITIKQAPKDSGATAA